MWQQLRKFPVRLNKNIQTNYFRTKNGEKTLRYNIKSEQSLCVGKYSISSTAYLSRHTTFNKEAQYDCYTVLYPNYAKGIVCHTPNRYHIQDTAVPKVLVHLCVCVCVFVCVVIPSILDAYCLHLSVSVGRASRGHTRVFLFFFRWWDKTIYEVQQYSSSTKALKSTSYFSRWIALLYSS